MSLVDIDPEELERLRGITYDGILQAYGNLEITREDAHDAMCCEEGVEAFYEKFLKSFLSTFTVQDRIPMRNLLEIALDNHEPFKQTWPPYSAFGIRMSPDVLVDWVWDVCAGKIQKAMRKEAGIFRDYTPDEFAAASWICKQLGWMRQLVQEEHKKRIDLCRKS